MSCCGCFAGFGSAGGSSGSRRGNIRDQYEFDKAKLGEGAYGSVCKARRKVDNAVRAIKKISKKDGDLTQLELEIHIMKMLDHPGIVKFYEQFEDSNFVYLVMEICAGGELFDKIVEAQSFRESQAATLMQQMIAAVNYCHRRNIAHRDLKPENFLFTSREAPIEINELKLIDFGLSAPVKKGKLFRTKAGTPYYVAPEVLAGRYNEISDVWSLGVIMFVLLSGTPPFYGDNDAQVLRMVQKGVYEFDDCWKNISADAKSLIRKMLTRGYTKRITANQALEDIWIKMKAPKAKDMHEGKWLVDRLRGFQTLSRLKKAALHVIAGLMNSDQINSLKQMFKAMDTNGDGMLSAAELREGLERGGLKSLPCDLEQLIKDMDSDRSGVIDYTEFLTAALEQRDYVQKDVCWSAFCVFDSDGDGKISKNELKAVLTQENVQGMMDNTSIEDIMAEADINGDGSVDFNEFMLMMKKPEKVISR